MPKALFYTATREIPPCVARPRPVASHFGRSAERRPSRWSTVARGRERRSLVAQCRREVPPLRCAKLEGEWPPYQDLAESVAKGLGGTNIYLVGMMGSGKTTVGTVIASSLKYLFMDSDALIEQAAKCSIQEIFEKEGEVGFRDIETAVLRDLHQYKNLVVSTGGGIVLRQMNWSYLHQGIVVFLNGAPEKLAFRVARDGLDGRPLLSKTPEEQEAQTSAVDVAREKLQSIYTEREKLYKSADIEVSLEDPLSESGLASVDEVVRRILSALNMRMEEAKEKRATRSQFEIRGQATRPDGWSTINTSSDSQPEGFA